MKFSKKGINLKKSFNNNKFNLKTPGGYAGFFPYLFVFLPLGFISTLACIPLFVVGAYGCNKNWDTTTTNPLFISGGICAGSGLSLCTFPLIAVFN